MISDLDGEVHCNESGPAAQSDNDEASRKVELRQDEMCAQPKFNNGENTC